MIEGRRKLKFTTYEICWTRIFVFALVEEVRADLINSAFVAHVVVTVLVIGFIREFLFL